ncbi:MAG: hypothetical protein M1128_01020 [Candidatus Marsarchaeota archaeon]|nr:hypothetical protein [Candidatus Marsarchaeota archaeon]
MNVSWHQLQQLQSVLHKTQTKRFAGKRKTPKYGSLSKAFSNIQFQRFLHMIDSDRFHPDYPQPKALRHNGLRQADKRESGAYRQVR